MTPEQMDRAIEFLLEHHAAFSTDIAELKEAQRRQTENIDKLTADVHSLTADVQSLAETAEINRQEIRDAIDNLIIANESSRHLAEEATKLAIQTSRRVTAHDDRLDSLERDR